MIKSKISLIDYIFIIVSSLTIFFCGLFLYMMIGGIISWIIAPPVPPSPAEIYAKLAEQQKIAKEKQEEIELNRYWAHKKVEKEFNDAWETAKEPDIIIIGIKKNND